MNTLFTVKVRYTKQNDNGSFKRVTEPYVLAAHTFSDAEARIYEELGSIIRGEFNVVSITRTELQDIFIYENFDVFYKAVVSFDSYDDDGEIKKKQKSSFLVTASSVKDANEKMKESLSGWLADYTIDAVSVTPVADFFPFQEVLDKEISRKPLEETEPEDFKQDPAFVDEL